MFELTFLGTAASAPTIQRGLSSLVVSHNEYRFMVDCGEGTQRQILLSGMGFKRLERILLTHSHLDHILGLGGLVSTLLRWDTIAQLEIYGSEYTLRRVKTLLYDVVLGSENTQFDLKLIPIRPGKFFDGPDFTITAVPVRHRGAGCLGYIFEEYGKRPFLNDRATELGVPAGPERRKLVQGESITLPDGKRITPDDVLGPRQRGTKLAVIGDTGRTDNLQEACRNADALVIEATYTEADRSMAKKYGHLTARQAAELARDAGVRELFLNHISRRYPERALLEEARAVFPSVRIAHDFDHYLIKAQEKKG